MTNKREALEALKFFEKLPFRGYDHYHDEQKLHTSLKTIRTALESMQWRDIESAPRDGSRILLNTNGHVEEAYYCTEDNRFYEANTHHTDATCGVIDVADAWMPLPTPPESEEV